MIRQVTFFLLLLMLALFSWWILSLMAPSASKRADIAGEGPDFFMENFISTEMSENGVPLRQIKAKSLTHYASDDRAELIQPVITVFEDQQNVWLTSARQGTVLAGGDEITLSGAVKIVKPLALNTTPNPTPEQWASQPATLTIDTQDLHIHVPEDYAVSQGSVIIKQNGHTLRSVGMQARFQSGEIDLLSQIRGKYEN